MLSLIEVKCPHCGAEGQILLPPLGAIIIGPCPECQGMVVVFCGRVFPLDKELMLHGSIEEKRDHIIQLLGGFVRERIDRMFAGQRRSESEVMADRLGDDAAAQEGAELPDESDGITLFGNAPSGPISQEELDSFISVDLKLIDNREYFRAVFE